MVAEWQNHVILGGPGQARSNLLVSVSTPEGCERSGHTIRLFPRTRQEEQPMWGHDTPTLDDFTIPCPIWHTALNFFFFFLRNGLAHKVREGLRLGEEEQLNWCELV